MKRRHRVAIVGAGFGGLFAAKRLATPCSVRSSPSLDARRLTVETVDRCSEIAYDSLIVATGASQSYLGARSSRTTRRDEDDRPRARIARADLGAFEMAEREPDPVARRRCRARLAQSRFDYLLGRIRLAAAAGELEEADLRALNGWLASR